MERLIEQLNELIKSYTIASSVARATQSDDAYARAKILLDKINQIRISLIINAEMREVFWLQKIVPSATNANTVQNIFISKNDINYILTRGIASLLDSVTITLLNQGGQARRTITRDPIPWQQLFSDVQDGTILGQQIPFDFPENLLFAENQSLNVGITGQTSDGFLFSHGATIKDNLAESDVNDIRREFLTDDGNVLYLPETQLIPITYKFANNAVDTVGTDPNGDSEIFSIKNDKSVLITHVSTNGINTRITVIDEGKNQTLCDTVETPGIAADQTNPFTTYYPMPVPHLLRRGDRFRLKVINGSNVTGQAEDADVLRYLTFKGQTI